MRQLADSPLVSRGRRLLAFVVIVKWRVTLRSDSRNSPLGEIGHTGHIGHAHYRFRVRRSLRSSSSRAIHRAFGVSTGELRLSGRPSRTCYTDNADWVGKRGEMVGRPAGHRSSVVRGPASVRERRKRRQGAMGGDSELAFQTKRV